MSGEFDDEQFAPTSNDTSNDICSMRVYECIVRGSIFTVKQSTLLYSGGIGMPDCTGSWSTSNSESCLFRMGTMTATPGQRYRPTG